MTADVKERAQHALAIAHHQDRFAGDVGGEERVWFGDLIGAAGPVVAGPRTLGFFAALVAMQLLPALITATRAAGMHQMIAVVGDSANHPSINLHRRFGFHDAGLLKDVGFKFGRWLDTVFLQRSLLED